MRIPPVADLQQDIVSVAVEPLNNQKQISEGETVFAGDERQREAFETIASVCCEEHSMPIDPRLKREKLLEAARGYLLLDMPDQALEKLDTIEDSGRSLFTVNQLRGECLRQKEQFRNALKAYHDALAERPRDLSVLLGMAWCYKRIDQLPEAIAAMERAHRIRPDEPIIMYNLSCYFALSGDKARALSWLGRALRKERGLRTLIPGESDFDRLRGDPDFQFVTGERHFRDA